MKKERATIRSPLHAIGIERVANAARQIADPQSVNSLHCHWLWRGRYSTRAHRHSQTDEPPMRVYCTVRHWLKMSSPRS